jgi:hypothetical protein
VARPFAALLHNPELARPAVDLLVATSTERLSDACLAL